MTCHEFYESADSTCPFVFSDSALPSTGLRNRARRFESIGVEEAVFIKIYRSIARSAHYSLKTTVYGMM